MRVPAVPPRPLSRRASLERSALGARARVLAVLGLAVAATGCGDNHQGVSIEVDEVPPPSAVGVDVAPVRPEADAPSPPTPSVREENQRPIAPGALCDDRPYPHEVFPPMLQLVVDTSGSMRWVPGTEREPRSGERSKWQITADAINAVLSDMPDSTAVGIAYYPNRETNRGFCYDSDLGVPIDELDSGQRRRIWTSNVGVRPVGGTPTHLAYFNGVRRLSEAEGVGEKYLLLITDGAPTYAFDCSGNGRDPVDATPLIDAIARAATNELRTFVVGLPGSENARAELSRMAAAGNTARPDCTHEEGAFCHFDLTDVRDFGAALRRVLATVTDTTLGCDFQLPMPPMGLVVDRGAIHVFLDGNDRDPQSLVQDTTGDCSAHWQLSNDGTSVHLCPSACERVRSSIKDTEYAAILVRSECTGSLAP